MRCIKRGSALGDVRAPTLLIVGAADTEVIDLNRQALRQLRCPKRLDLVPRATHLFEEAGTLEEVARLAGDLVRGAPRVRRLAGRIPSCPKRCAQPGNRC